MNKGVKYYLSALGVGLIALTASHDFLYAMIAFFGVYALGLLYELRTEYNG